MIAYNGNDNNNDNNNDNYVDNYDDDDIHSEYVICIYDFFYNRRQKYVHRQGNYSDTTLCWHVNMLFATMYQINVYSQDVN